MNDENILQQYEFLWILEIIHKFIISLETLKIRPKDLIRNSEIQNTLAQLVPQVINELAEKGFKRITINSKENCSEIKSIWNSIVIESKEISIRMITLLSIPEDQMSESLTKTTADISSGKLDPFGIMFIKFFSNPVNLENPFEQAELGALFEASCDLISQKYKSEVLALTPQECYAGIRLTESEKACLDYIRSYLNQSLLYVFKSYVGASDKESKRTEEELSLKSAQNMQIFSNIYQKVLKSCQIIFQAANEASKTLKEQELEGRSETGEVDQSYRKYYKELYDICYSSNDF